MSEDRMPTQDHLDPTRVTDQPALRTSSGLIWIVVGALFVAVSLVPFGFLILSPDSRSAGPALSVAVVIVVLYGAMLLVRFTVNRRTLRLRLLAGCLLAMAAFALVGIWICAIIEGAPR